MALKLKLESLFRGKALALNNRTIIRNDIPMGDEGWAMMLLSFLFDLTIGTGTGAISEGELNIIKNVNFSTDEDADTHDGPAKPFFRYGEMMDSVMPLKDAVAAATGKYRVNVPLWFSTPRSRRPEDTILDTGRYSAAELTIDLGGLSDLLTSVGTAALSASLDVMVLRSDGALELDDKPLGKPYYKCMDPTDPSIRQYIELERAADLRLLRLFWMTMNSVTNGVRFSGTPAENVIDTLSVEHQKGSYKKEIGRNQLLAHLKMEQSVTTLPTGCFLFDFMEDGSVFSAILADPKLHSKLNMTWKNDTLSTSAVNPMICGMRALTPQIGD